MPKQLDRWTYGSLKKTQEELFTALDALAKRFPEHDAQGPIVFTGFSLGAILGVRMVGEHGEKFPRAVFTEGGEKWSTTLAKAFVEEGGQRVLFACGQTACKFTSKRAASLLEREKVGRAHRVRRQHRAHLRRESGGRDCRGVELAARGRRSLAERGGSAVVDSSGVIAEPLDGTRAAEAAGVLTRAFEDNPATLAIFAGFPPDELKRGLGRAMTAFVDISWRHGTSEVLLRDGRVAGVALTFGPGAYPPPFAPSSGWQRVSP